MKVKYIYECSCGNTWESNFNITHWGEICKECGEYASWQGKCIEINDSPKKSLKATIEEIPDFLENVINNHQDCKNEIIMFWIAFFALLGTYYIIPPLSWLLQFFIVTFFLCLIGMVKEKLR